MRFIFIYVLFYWIIISSCSKLSKSEVNGNASSIGFETPQNNSEIKEDYLSPIDYVSWVKDPENNLHKYKQINEFEFELLQKPKAYVICMDQKTESITTDNYNKLEKEFGDLLYFDFSIKVVDLPIELLKYKVGGEAEYQRRVNYFAYEMQNDFCLVDENDTIPCIMFHYERAYDIVPYAKVLLGFNSFKKNNNKTFEFIYRDRVFNHGYIKFTFRKSDIENIPKLKTV